MRLKRFTIFLFLVTIIGSGLFAQQEPQFTQNMFNRVFTNPGFAGLGDGICVTGLVRQQWAGFKDSEGNKVAPETFLISIELIPQPEAVLASMPGALCEPLSSDCSFSLS